jgi:hypothetical protein
MFNDNQAAVQRLTSLQTTQGQDGTRRLAEITDTPHDRNNALRIHWVPGYVDVAGNEPTDKLDKDATKKPPPSLFETSPSYLQRLGRQNKTPCGAL